MNDFLATTMSILLMPISVIALILLAAFALLAARRFRAMAWLLAFACLLTWLFATPLVGQHLQFHLERGFQPVAAADAPVRGCVVLLGGAAVPERGPGDWQRASSTGRRIAHTVALVEAGKAHRVLVSAGAPSRRRNAGVEADAIRDVLVENGIPEQRILLERNSRSTRENAVESAALLAEAGCARPLLVTSAAHMRRAASAFRRAGVDVVPAATDFRVYPAQPSSGLRPSLDAFNATSKALRELAARRYYALRGWT